MIPNHPRFLEAIEQKKKVSIKFYSKADNGVLDRICAPIGYGIGSNNEDGLNRYWVWDYERSTGSQTLGLIPQQIVELQVLGEEFDPSAFALEALALVEPKSGLIPPVIAASPEAQPISKP